jgi:hypothetical protein
MLRSVQFLFELEGMLIVNIHFKSLKCYLKVEHICNYSLK